MKYRNKPTGGYASKKEAKRASELKIMLQAGLIVDLREQVKYELIPKQDGERACAYIADFTYIERSPCGELLRDVVEDCKGMRTPAYIIKRKLMLHVHGIRIKEV